MALYHVYSHRSGVDNPRGQNFCQQKPLITSVICYKFKKKMSLKSDFKHFFSWFYLYMYKALGQGLTTPWERNFNVIRNILSLRSFVASFKKSLWSLILYNFFHDFIHVYSPRAGTDSPQGTKFWCQQKCLVTPFVASLKKVFEVWFYTLFNMI